MRREITSFLSIIIFIFLYEAQIFADDIKVQIDKNALDSLKTEFRDYLRLNPLAGFIPRLNANFDGISFRASSVKYSGRLDLFELKFINGGISVGVLLNDLDFTSSILTVSREFIKVPVQVTCKKVNIKSLTSSKAIRLNSTIFVRNDGDNLDFGFQRPKLAFDPKSIMIAKGMVCSGSEKLGGVVSVAVPYIAGQLKAYLELGLREKLQGFIRLLKNYLTEKLQGSHGFLLAFPILDEPFFFRIRSYLNSLSLSEDGLQLGVALKIDDDIFSLTSKELPVEQRKGVVPLALIGINTTLIEKFWNLLPEENGLEIILDKDKQPEFFNFLLEILSNLSLIPRNSEARNSYRFVFSLKDPPKINSSISEEIFEIEVAGIDLKVQAAVEKNWHDVVCLTLTAKIPVRLFSENNSLLIEFHNKPSAIFDLTFSGNEYAPQAYFLDKSLVEIFVRSLYDFLRQSGPFVLVENINYSLAPSVGVYPARFRYQPPFLMLDLVKG